MNNLSINYCPKNLSNRFKNIALLCAFFVVAIHCATQLQLKDGFFSMAFYDGICRVAVPFFFFMSGFFLAGSTDETGWWKVQVKKRMFTLLVPYLIFNSIFGGLHLGAKVILKMQAGRACMVGIDASAIRMLTVFGLNPLSHPYLLPLWYIRALFVLVLVSPVIVGMISFSSRLGRFGVWYLLMALFGLYGILAPYEGGGFYVFRKLFALQGLFYLSCGMAFRYGLINVVLSRGGLKLLVAICGICFLVLKVLAQSYGFCFYIYLGWLAVPFLMISLFNLMSENGLPVWIASCSFPIYLVHMFFVRRTSELVKTHEWRVGEDIFLWCLIVVLIFLVSLLIVSIQRRFLPALNRWFWGGR